MVFRLAVQAEEDITATTLSLPPDTGMHGLTHSACG